MAPVIDKLLELPAPETIGAMEADTQSSEQMDYTTVKPKTYSRKLAPVDTKVIKKSALSMIVCSILIIFVLYGDGLAILSELPILTNNAVFNYTSSNRTCSVVIGDLKLSMPKLLFLFFNAGGVFNRIPDNNIEYALYGRHVGADPTKPWEDLNFVKACFPYDSRGEIYDRLTFPWHSSLGEAPRATAMKNLLVKIKDKYNREHAQNPIDKVAIYMLWWPWSEDGFYTNKQPASTHWQLMAEE